MPPIAKISWDPKVTLGNVLTILVMLGTLAAGYINLQNDVAAASEQIDEIREDIKPLATMETRLTLTEVSTRSLRSDVDKSADRFDELNRTMSQVLQSLARVEEAVKRQ